MPSELLNADCGLAVSPPPENPRVAQATPAARRPSARRKVLRLEALRAELEARRAAGCRIALTYGVFDLLHMKQVRWLENAATSADILVVAVERDGSVQTRHSSARPVVVQSDRAEMLAALMAVDYVVTFDADARDALVRDLRPDLLVLGGADAAEQAAARQIVESCGGHLRVTGAAEAAATAQWLARLRGRLRSSAKAVVDAGEATTADDGQVAPAMPEVETAEAPSAPAGTKTTDRRAQRTACVHLGAEIGQRGCATCNGNVRQKVFACDHPKHSETTIAGCGTCPDYEEPPAPAEPTKSKPAESKPADWDHGPAEVVGAAPARPHDLLRDAPELTTIGPNGAARNGRRLTVGHAASTRLVLKSFQCPGDIVMLTAAVRDLHLAHPGRFTTDVRTSCPALWENNPHITRLDERADDVRTIDMHYDLINQSNTAPFHFVHGYAQHLEQQLGVRIPVTRFHGDIYLTPIEKQWLSQVEEQGFGGDFWIVMAGGKHDFTGKWWNPASFQEVVDHFRGRIQFVQCGEQCHFHQPLEGVVNLVGKTDLRQFVRLMYHASGVLCPVTFAMHLAAAVETKPGRPPNRACVVLGGGREPPHWEAYPHHQFLSTVGALPCCQHGGCWRSRCQPVGDGDAKDRDLCERPVQVTPELRIAKCMEMITPDDVIRRIEWYYEGGTLRYSDAREAVAVTA